MDVGGIVCDIAVSRDGKRVVSGTTSGWVKVWNAESHKKVIEWEAHTRRVRAVDVSPDATKIATGSEDGSHGTLCVWSLSTGKRLIDPIEHINSVVAVKFSPDGRLVATATWDGSVRVYGSQNLNGRLLFEFPIKVNSLRNQSLAWASDNKQLFALSRDGNIHCLDVSTGTTLSKWPTRSEGADCIALANNGTFVAVSALFSVSFWDTTTHNKIECVVHHAPHIMSIAISSNHDIVTTGGNKITVRNLRDVLPSSYCDDVSAFTSNAHRVKWPPNDELLF